MPTLRGSRVRPQRRTDPYFLQACFGGAGQRPYSGVAHSLISQARVALSIGALSAVSAAQSTTFACRFYNQLRLGRDISEARQLASAAYTDDDAEWGMITLFARTEQLAHEFLRAPWELSVGEEQRDGETRIVVAGPNHAPVCLPAQRYDELKSAREQHAKAPREESAVRLSRAVRDLLSTADALPPMEFQGDVALRGGLSLSSYPWEQLPYPTPGQPLLKREGVFIVRELSETGLQGVAAGTSGAAGLCLSDVPEHQAMVRDMTPSFYDSVTIESTLREQECACLVLTVRVEDGRPQVPGKLRGSRAMRDSDLIKLRDRLWWKPAKLIILDLVGCAEVTLSVEGASASGRALSLVKVLLDQAFGEVVLAPAVAVDSADWRASYMQSCTRTAITMTRARRAPEGEALNRDLAR